MHREILQHLIIWKRWRFLPTSPSQKTSTNAQQRENLVQEYQQKFEQLSETQKKHTMFWCGFEACRTRTILLFSWYRRTRDATLMPRMYDASQWKRTRIRGWMDSQEYENRPSHEHESLLSWWSIQYWNSNSISVSKQYRFLRLASWMVLISTWQNRCWPRKKRTQLRRTPLLKHDQGRSPQ